MRIFTKYLVLIILGFYVTQASGQETSKKNDQTSKIEILNESKEAIKTEERELLKTEVEAINQRLDNQEISQTEAENLKKEAAKKHALNIENRIAIIDNKIALLERNGDNENIYVNDGGENVFLRIGSGDNTSDKFIFLGEKRFDKPRKFDRRTTSDIVFAIGFNNTLIEGEKIDDSPYELAGSGFVELGWAWKTRLMKNSNAIRLKYGFSFMWNKLDIKDNKYFVNDEGAITLEDFPYNLKKAKFRTTSLVFPLHFEFGPSKKIERNNYFRYSTHKQFKIGLGGFAGFNIGTLQKLKYKKDGKDVKDKLKGGYNTTDFVYGLSGYVAFGNVGVYAKYDLSPVFKDQAIEQNNISIGLRFDMD
jgi:hypothetical protein